MKLGPKNDNEENKTIKQSNIQVDSINKQNILTQKPSIKNTLINNNLSFKVLPNSSVNNYSTINKSSNKSPITSAPSKGIFINQNISASSLNKLNYAFNKNNAS